MPVNQFGLHEAANRWWRLSKAEKFSEKEVEPILPKLSFRFLKAVRLRYEERLSFPEAGRRMGSIYDPTKALTGRQVDMVIENGMVKLAWLSRPKWVGTSKGYFSMPTEIDELELPTRIFSNLRHRLGVFSVDALCGYTAEDIMNSTKLNIASIRELRIILEFQGRCLKGDGSIAKRCEHCGHPTVA